MDIRLPQEFLQKLQLESPDLPRPLSRMSRRASLVSPKRVRGHESGTPCPQHGYTRPGFAVAPQACSSFWASGATCWPQQTPTAHPPLVNIHSINKSQQG